MIRDILKTVFGLSILTGILIYSCRFNSNIQKMTITSGNPSFYIEDISEPIKKDIQKNEMNGSGKPCSRDPANTSVLKVINQNDIDDETNKIINITGIKNPNTYGGILIVNNNKKIIGHVKIPIDETPEFNVSIGLKYCSELKEHAPISITSYVLYDGSSISNTNVIVKNE